MLLAQLLAPHLAAERAVDDGPDLLAVALAAFIQPRINIRHRLELPDRPLACICDMALLSTKVVFLAPPQASCVRSASSRNSVFVDGSLWIHGITHNSLL